MGIRIESGDLRTGMPVAAFGAGLPAVQTERRTQALVPAETPGPARRGRYVIPALLLAGWGGLFAYCATYLREDLPFRPASPSDAPPRTEDPPRRPFVLPDVPGAASRVPSAGPSQAEAPVSPLAAAAPAVPPRPVPSQVMPDYVGTWGPTAAACGRPSRRRGYLPATITADRAKAGRTLCAFRDGHRSGNAWVMAADCSDRGRHWSSQVRLMVEGDHLTWSSNRGTASYIRCGRRTGG